MHLNLTTPLKRKILTTLFCIIVGFAQFCSQDNGGTDIVTISSVNTFITESDIKNGINKTTARMSRVLLSHQAHEDAGVRCIACHRKKDNDSRIKKCVYCHKGLQGAEHLHKVCIKCHEEKKRGPIYCNKCHIEDDTDYLNKEMREEYHRDSLYKKNICKMYDIAGVKCNVCHHKSDNTDDKTIKEKKCSDCHTGKSRMRIMHVFCKNCHISKDTMPSGSTKKGPIDCDDCHK